MENQDKQPEIDSRSINNKIDAFFGWQSPAEFFKTRRAGFYLSVVASLLLLIAAIVYGAGYSHSVYKNGGAVACAVVGVALFTVLTVAKFTRRYAPIVLFIFGLAAFLMFISSSYLYFSEIFFGTNFAGAMKAMDPKYAVCLLFFLLSVILSNIGIYMKNGKEEPAV